VRLHAGAYARESLVTTTDTRIYVVIPQNQKTAPAAWVGGMLDRLTRRTGLELRAAVAAPVGALADIGAARAEVDRVLDRSGMERVTTLAASRTSVLLGEVADLVAGDDQLRDPRLEALVADDRARDGSLLISVERYLDRFGDVRAAAGELHVHPNTLRYRIRRAEQVLGMRLDDPEDRLLLQIQILRRRRSG
jgi:DNA-binding PucR family transcriptional regulator